jgi:hypothetical protein
MKPKTCVMRGAVWALLLGAPVLSGCVGVALVAGGAAGAGTAVYVKGELQEDVKFNTEQTKAAIEKATKRLGLAATKTAADKLSGAYTYRTAKDEKVQIRYEKLTEELTRLRVRVGVFGDENLSRALMDEIKKDLG